MIAWVLGGAMLAAVVIVAVLRMRGRVVDPVFGVIAPDEGYWETTVRHGNGSIDVSLTIEDAIDAHAVLRLTRHLEAPEQLVSTARAAMVANASTADSAVTLYRDHHIKELSAEELRSCLGDDDTWRTDTARFVAALQLDSIALEPDEDDRALVLDFTIGKEASNYLLAVCLDADGAVHDVTMES